MSWALIQSICSMLIQVKTYRPTRRIILIRCILLVPLLTIVLFGVAIWVSKHSQILGQKYSSNQIQRINDAKSCFWPKRAYNNFRLLDMLEAEKSPQPVNAIFFHETSCTRNLTIQLNARYKDTNTRSDKIC